MDLSLTILSIQVGLPKKIGLVGAPLPMDRDWTSGFYKQKVSGPVRVGRTNLEGDGQADLAVHGGPDKAINIYPSEHYDYWKHDLGLESFPSGAFGENLTLAGATEADVCLGDIFESGEQGVRLQISQPRQPCWKLARRWKIKDLSARVDRTGKTGWYFRVLREGILTAGDVLHLVERPYPEWPITATNRILNSTDDNFAETAQLADCPALAEILKKGLSRRVATRSPADSSGRLTDPG